MGCRCQERREAIGRGVIALVRGDIAAVRSAAAFVGRSAAEDLRTMELRRKLSQQVAKAQLIRK